MTVAAERPNIPPCSFWIFTRLFVENMTPRCAGSAFLRGTTGKLRHNRLSIPHEVRNAARWSGARRRTLPQFALRIPQHHESSASRLIFAVCRSEMRQLSSRAFAKDGRSSRATSTESGAAKARSTARLRYAVGIMRPIAWSSSAPRDSIVATDPKIGLVSRMPWRWPFASNVWRAVPRCCPWAFWLAERRLPAA
jgi:hypothetical protein